MYLFCNINCKNNDINVFVEEMTEFVKSAHLDQVWRGGQTDSDSLHVNYSNSVMEVQTMPSDTTCTIETASRC